MLPPVSHLSLAATHRLAPARYPATGILDAISSPEDLPAILELVGWTDDHVAAELGIIHSIPHDEWVVGEPYASVIMAAYCHPRPGGARFSDQDRGAWYACLTLDTAHAEVMYHRTRELEEVGILDARVTMRHYTAQFDNSFHDIRGPNSAYDDYHHPDSYRQSQALAQELLVRKSNGIIYRSVRHPGGECLACFRPKLVTHVRVAGHFDYVWNGRPAPRIILIS